MKKAIIAILVSLTAAFNLMAQLQDTMTGCLNERVKSLQVQLNGFPLDYPILIMNTDNQLIFSFDHLAEDREYLRYELIHCNANWQPSGLVDSEYLDGFNQADIEYYDYSQMTTTHYVHYEFAIPNEQMMPRLSGNYLVRVYPDNDPDDTWLQCRFMVSEQTAKIDASCTSRTDVDFNKTHQQLEIVVDVERSDVRDPFNDLKIMIQQNGRYDNEVMLQQPLRLADRKVTVYEHLPKLIFDAGNEYRRMETTSVTFPTMGVRAIEYHQPYYHIALETDYPRNEEMYLYDQTQHGRYFIREYNSDQSEIEADYVVVHFTLDLGGERPNDLIFLDGDFVHRRFDPESLMTYNRATGLYERNMLLKQGAYNYQYLTVPNGKNRGYTGPIEGDKYQTQNEYLIKIYARHIGDRYDRLIGTTVVSM